MAPKLVSSPNQITSQWLTDALGSGSVTDFTATSIGTGQVGENVRFELTGDDVPDSVVGKFPSDDPVSKQTGIAQNNYVREVFFYKTLQDTVDIQTPKVFFTDIDETTHDFVILMEDLAPGIQGDQLKGCSIDEAALALEELAKLQGPRWGDQSLASHPLLAGASSDPAALQMLYKALEPSFLERYGSRLSSEHIAITEKVGDSLLNYNDVYNGPNGLIHIDYRLDNMMFGGPYPLAVVDWQSISIGCPVLDASYFLGTSLQPEARGKHEHDLVTHYLDVLKSYKIEFSPDDCHACYRNYAPAGLIMAVIASMIVGETERGNDMFMAMATRSAQMCIELDY